MERNTFSKICLKLFFRLFGLDICCLTACAFCITSGGSRLVRTLLQIACIIVLISFVYPICHKFGDVDASLMNTGSRKINPLKGLIIGLVCSSPFIISGVVLLVSKLFNILPVFVNYYKIINSFFFPFLYSILPVDYTIVELSLSSVLGSLSIQLVIPVICMFAYMLGLERFSFSEKVFYKKKED